MIHGLSAEVICAELARLVAQRWEVPAEAFVGKTAVSDDLVVMYAPGVSGGLQVAVKTMPLEFHIKLGRKYAVVTAGGADRFLSLPAFSDRFILPSAAALCNSVERL